MCDAYCSLDAGGGAVCNCNAVGIDASSGGPGDFVGSQPKLLEALTEASTCHRRKSQKTKHCQHQRGERHSEDQRSHKCFQFVTHLHVGNLALQWWETIVELNAWVLSKSLPEVRLGDWSAWNSFQCTWPHSLLSLWEESYGPSSGGRFQTTC